MIAILGATGYIGRSLAREIAANDDESLTLFARAPAVLGDTAWPRRVSIRPLNEFRADEFDVVVNAIGAGGPAKVAALGADLVDVTRTWDERVLKTMNSNTGYVFLSSGAIYGTVFDQPVDQNSELAVPVNQLESFSAYTLSKLYAEARHRHHATFRIMDIRIFGYADMSIPLESGFFLADLVRSMVRGEVLTTSPDAMIRDYVGSAELLSLIGCWREANNPNCALDLYSLAPVSKQELLDHAISCYGLKIHFAEAGRRAAEAKRVFASSFRGAADIGYTPWRTSMEIVSEVLAKCMRRAER